MCGNAISGLCAFWRRRECIWIAVAMLALGSQLLMGQSDSAGSNSGPNDSGLNAASETAAQTVYSPRTAVSPESEIGMEGLGSVGHFHIFANSWWSDLYYGGVEYYRNSWGHGLGAKLDYTAAVDGVVVWQPTLTTVWGNYAAGNPQRAHEYVEGVNLAPIGIRMTWFDKKAIKPYLTGRGGIMGTTKKSPGTYASYLNYTLQVGIGAQFRVSSRWDARVGWGYYHFSDGFMVPSNPGLDSTGYTCGLNYHLGGRRNP
jgi:opacity protein-like surface antigen